MLNRTAPVQEEKAESWQRELACAVSDARQLLALLDIEQHPLLTDADDDAGFRVRVPRPWISRMRKGDPNDPLLLQVLVRDAERLPAAGFCTDPVGDGASHAGPGLLQKYAGRALIIASAACAIHCRYCFRRHYPYADNRAASGHWQQALDHVAGQPDLAEVILSGGDPLSLSDARLADLLRRIQAIRHVRRLRIHTRLPIAIPARVTDALLDLLSKTRLQTVVVVHVNHGNEIDSQVGAAMLRLKSACDALLNQSVLLAGINDDAAVLAELGEKLLAAGVLPYYLHLLDRVAGSAHFEVDQGRAQDIMQDLRARLPGYLVPRLVRETPGSDAKIPL